MKTNTRKLFLIFSPLLICLIIGIVITYLSLEDGKLLNTQNLRENELNAQYNKIILQYEDADLLTFNNVFYIKYNTVQPELTSQINLKNPIGEITKKYNSDKPFENQMSTKLDIGTKVFLVNNHPELLAIVNQKNEIYFYKTNN